MTPSRRLTVLVTGVGGGGHGHEVVKALKLADRYRIIGVDMSEHAFGLFDVDEAYTVPAASHPEYVDVLLDICASRGATVVAHGSEPELRVISENRARFESAGVLPLINDSRVIALGLDKAATMAFLREHGFAFPRTVLVCDGERPPRDFPLPAVIKPAVGGGGSANTYLVQDMEELEFSVRLLCRGGQNALVQEYVGTPDDEFTVGVLHTLDGNFAGSIAVRRFILSGLSNRIKVRNRTGRAELSPVLAISSGVSQGVVEDHPLVRRTCEAIATALRSRGPLNIQCRIADGVVYPFEINPRLSGTTYMRALVGFNEPDILIRLHLLGEQVELPPQYRHGRLVRGLVERYTSDHRAPAPWTRS